MVLVDVGDERVEQLGRHAPDGEQVFACLVRRDDQHRAGGAVQQAMRDAAQHQRGPRRASARSCDDQPGSLVLCELGQCLRGAVSLGYDTSYGIDAGGARDLHPLRGDRLGPFLVGLVELGDEGRSRGTSIGCAALRTSVPSPVGCQQRTTTAAAGASTCPATCTACRAGSEPS